MGIGSGFGNGYKMLELVKAVGMGSESVEDVRIGKG